MEKSKIFLLLTLLIVVTALVSCSSDDSSSPLDINMGGNVVPIYPCLGDAAESGFMTRECYDLTFDKYKGLVALVYYEIDTDGLILLRRINNPEIGNEIVTGAGFCDWNGITVEQASKIMLDGTATEELIKWYSLNDLENLYSLKYRDCRSFYDN
ncbi:MAG: hypothetical protein FWC26_03480 [Fibromonadales bacterium]|nr:hypothetical protein [Fibromonadales bacterium]